MVLLLIDVDPLAGDVDIDVNASIRCFCECTLFNDELLVADDVLKLLPEMLFAFEMQPPLPNDTAFSNDSARRGVE